MPRPSPEHRPAPLPEAQVELVALLADNPHMCAVAEREGALEELIDPRLRRLARAITEAAKRGEHPGEGDLLADFELAEQRPLHDKVFCGTYRGTELDLVAVLQELLAVLRRERTQRQIGAIDDEMIGARQRGELDRLRALTLERVALRRQLDNFRLNPTNPAVQADPVRT